MYADPNYAQKTQLLHQFGAAVYGALDDPNFNGSRPTTQREQHATGNRSRDPIRLETTQRPFRDSLTGPRTCVLKIPGGMHGDRLDRAITKNSYANLRPLVPWPFDGEPQVYFSGKHLCVEIAWPKELHAGDIPLSALRPNVSDGKAAILGPNTRGSTVTLRLDDKLNAHALIGGMTGSGKSTAMQLLLSQLAHDDDARFILCDGKAGQGLGPLNGVPGQIGPLATERTAIINALGWAWLEMNRRNANPGETHFPIYIVFDEFDGYTAYDRTVARVAYLLAKQGRTARIHLIWATQSPRQDMFIEKGTKGQFPVRIALKVAAYEESAAIVDHPMPRADYLLGCGDAHLVAPGQIERVQLAYPEAPDLRAVTGGEPQWSRWPGFDASLLDGDDSGMDRAEPFTNEEALVALKAALSGWKREKVKRIIRDALGYGMGSTRIDESLLPYGASLAELWRKME